MRVGTGQRKDWLRIARGAAGAAARASGVPFLAVLVALWPATWLLRLLHLLPANLICQAGLADSTAGAAVWLYVLWRGRRMQGLRKIWREQRGRMGDAVYGGTTGNLSDMHGADDPDSPAAKLAACQRELDARRAEQALRCDPGVMERLEATERALEILKAGIRSVQAVTGEEIIADGEHQRPELRMIRGGLAG